MESTPTGPSDALTLAPLEGPTACVFRRVGLLLFLIAALLPYHGCRVHPGQIMGETARVPAYYDRANPGVSGAAYAKGLLRRALDLKQSGQHETRYGDFMGPRTFLALPFWFAALLLVRGTRPRVRLAVGTILWILLGATFIAVAADGWNPFRPMIVEHRDPEAPWFWPMKSPWTWLGIAGGLLLLRPRHRWEIRDVEATVESQALLGLGLCLVTPAWQAWSWAFQEGYPFTAVAQALWANYRVGFWLALVALALIAAPLFLSEEFLGRLRDRLRRTPPSARP